MATDRESASLPQIDGFQVVRELGRGGMGVVYLARDMERDQLVALKMIAGSSTPGAAGLARFRIEAGALTCLRHPNITQIHGLGIYAGLPFLVLEYVAGGNLAQKLNGQPQPPLWSAKLIQQLAQVLSVVHAKGILHRDIKPSNVLFAEDGTLKLSDLGLAKLTLAEDPLTMQSREVLSYAFEAPAEQIDGDALRYSIDRLWEARARRSGLTEPDPDVAKVTSFVEDWLSQLQDQQEFRQEVRDSLGPFTEQGDIIGTPHYMPPERSPLAALPPSANATEDIYSLGAVLYEMLTGRPPYHDVSAITLCRRQLHEARHPIDPPVSLELEAICEKCLQYDPRNRYQSANELAEDLERFLCGYRTQAAQAAERDGQRIAPGRGKVVSPKSTSSQSTVDYRRESHRSTIWRLLDWIGRRGTTSS
ncbi:MAG: serine/threonine-protein kinase [Isosphaeraceae bacterium]